MDTFGDLLRQHAIDHPVLLDPRFGAEGLCHDSDTKVAFSARSGTGMTGVAMRFIDDFEARWRESRLQLSRDALSDGSEVSVLAVHDVVAEIGAADYN